MSVNPHTSATVSTLALTPSVITTTTTTTTTPTRSATTTSIDSSVSTASTVVDSREQMSKPVSKPAPAAPVSTLTPLKTEPGAASTHSALVSHSASEDHKKRVTQVAPAEPPVTKKIKSEHSGLAKHQIKFALASLRAVKRLRDASPFLVPVDIVRFNIPTYFDYVKKPMDLSTMERKVSAGTYRSADDFFADMDLIVSNCVLFNGPQAEISQMARNMKASFDKHMRNMPPFEAPPPPPPKPKRKSFTSSTLPKSQRVTSGITPKPVHSTSIPHASSNFSSSSNTTNNNNNNNNHHHPNSINSADSASKPFALHPSGMPMIRRDSAINDRPKREIHPTRPKDVPYSDVKPRRKKYAAELKFCGSVLKELMSKRHETFSFPFLEPVDPVALNCPDYFKIIKEPMDLSTISTKYNTNHYENAREFEADVRLMLRNCYKFNPEGSPVNLMGHRLEALFDKKWADKPVTPATPPPQSAPSGLVSSASGDLSDSEYDSEDQQAIAANTTIKFLEEQLLRMQQELAKMKRETVRESRERRAKLQPHTAAHKKPKPTAAKKPTTGTSGSANNGSSSSKPGGSAADGAPKKKAPVRRRSNTTSAKPASNGKPVEVTYEMKKELSEAIGTLPEKKMIHVLTVIQESMPQLRNTDQEEIELDMDTLDPATLWKLYTYVVAPKASSSAVTALSTGTAAATGEMETNGSSAAADYKHQQHSKKKTKPLSDAEQSRQIEQIQKKIEQFERAESGTPHSAAAIADISSSSDEDDDDDDDSSSEEE